MLLLLADQPRGSWHRLAPPPCCFHVRLTACLCVGAWDGRLLPSPWQLCPYPDLIPMWDGGASSSYEVCGLEEDLLPCLQRWSLGRREALWEIAVQVRRAYAQAQLSQLQRLPDGS